MRTTIIIPDPIFNRVKALTKKTGMRLSELISEAIELRLLQEDNKKTSKTKKFTVKSFSLGKPLVDVNNRDDLYNSMGN